MLLSGNDDMGVFTAVIHKEENIYVVECPEVGTFSQGETIDKAVKNIKEATELYLEEFPMKGDIISFRNGVRLRI